MSEHLATIQWKRNQATFTDNKYSREHTWQFDGGLEISASASPHIVPVPYSNSKFVDPEEAFVASLSSCHMLWFLAIAAKQTRIVESYFDCAVGLMEHNLDGKLAFTQIRLRPKVIFGGTALPTNQQVEAIHKEAHQSCFLASSIKAEVVIEINKYFRVNREN